MAGADADNGNGKVTMAVIGTKLDRVIEDLREIKEGQARLKETVAAHTEQIADNTDEIDRLRNVSTGWSVINSLAVGVAAWLGLRN